MDTKETQLQLVTHEQAKRLKEVGFDWNVDSAYHSGQLAEGMDYSNHSKNFDVCSAPTVALALKWFRDVKGIVNSIKRVEVSDNMYFVNNSYEYIGQFKDLYITDYSYPTYEQAESVLLDELLTLTEQDNENR